MALRLDSGALSVVTLERLPAADLAPDPGLDQIIPELSGLTERISRLADQVDELKKSRGG
jgi:hypothetical protein